MKVTKFTFIFLSLFLLLSIGNVLAGQWPMQLEGNADNRNVLFESFLRPT